MHTSLRIMGILRTDRVSGLGGANAKQDLYLFEMEQLMQFTT